MRDIPDAQLGRIIAVGAVIGMVGLFILVVAISLIAGATIGQAVGIAIVPTFFGGWFYGGTVLMLRAAYGETRGPATSAPPAVDGESGVRRAA